MTMDERVELAALAIYSRRQMSAGVRPQGLGRLRGNFEALTKNAADQWRAAARLALQAGAPELFPSGKSPNPQD